MNNKKAGGLIRMCLDEMYQASIPPISWAECEKQYVDVRDWYWKHSISLVDYTRIKTKYKKKLDRVYHNTLDMELLNYSPRLKTKDGNYA